MKNITFYTNAIKLILSLSLKMYQKYMKKKKNHMHFLFFLIPFFVQTLPVVSDFPFPVL